MSQNAVGISSRKESVFIQDLWGKFAPLSGTKERGRSGDNFRWFSERWRGRQTFGDRRKRGKLQGQDSHQAVACFESRWAGGRSVSDHRRSTTTSTRLLYPVIHGPYRKRGRQRERESDKDTYLSGVRRKCTYRRRISLARHPSMATQSSSTSRNTLLLLLWRIYAAWLW